MSVPKQMKYLSISLLTYVLVALFMIACNGPHKTHVPQNSAADSVPISQDTSASGSQLPTQNRGWIEDLFFIDGQICAWVRNIFQDSRGDLWFATNHFGIMRYDGDTLAYFDEDDGVGMGRVTGIVEDNAGNIWFGTYGGLTQFDGHSFTNYAQGEGLHESEIWSLIIDRKGIFWVGTIEGVYQFDPSKAHIAGEKMFTPFPIPQAKVDSPNIILSPDRISSILEDREGTLWFGTDGMGICQYNPSTGKFSHLTKKDGLPDNNVSGMMEDTKGNIWIGTMFGGVSKFDPSARLRRELSRTLKTGGKSFTNYTQDGVIDGIEISGFYEDKRGDIWFAAENHGVFSYDGNSFTNLYKEEGLPTNGILSILEDQEGRFWLGGWGGLFRYEEKSFITVTKEGPWQ